MQKCEREARTNEERKDKQLKALSTVDHQIALKKLLETEGQERREKEKAHMKELWENYQKEEKM